MTPGRRAPGRRAGGGGCPRVPYTRMYIYRGRRNLLPLTPPPSYFPFSQPVQNQVNYTHIEVYVYNLDMFKSTGGFGAWCIPGVGSLWFMRKEFIEFCYTYRSPDSVEQHEYFRAYDFEGIQEFVYLAVMDVNEVMLNDGVCIHIGDPSGGGVGWDGRTLPYIGP